jgi:hypothetical protein
MDSLESDLISREAFAPGTPFARFVSYLVIVCSPGLGDPYMGLWPWGGEVTPSFEMILKRCS